MKLKKRLTASLKARTYAHTHSEACKITRSDGFGFVNVKGVHAVKALKKRGWIEDKEAAVAKSAEPPERPDGVDLSKLNKRELIAIAGERGIPVNSGMKKDELIAALQ